MPRQIEPIDEEELLFRGLHSDWVDGDRLLPAAIQIPECSVARARFSSGEPPIVPSLTEHNGVAALAPKAFPPPYQHESNEWHFTADDAPLEDAEAHAHITLRAVRGGEPKKPSGKTIKNEVRVRLADRFKVTCVPKRPA